MTPDPNRHEASRIAFEWPYKPAHIERRETGQYFSAQMEQRWDVWCRALDWRAAQVCGWTHDATNEEYDTDCAHSFRCIVYGWDCVPGFCAGCGRRVKIITSETTTTPNNHEH